MKFYNEGLQRLSLVLPPRIISSDLDRSGPGLHMAKSATDHDIKFYSLVTHLKLWCFTR
uniref:Uncharacterized protein n=1 Tax=Anopheles minimus TaxID=112268 RepID=A0A182WPM1_9DIPT